MKSKKDTEKDWLNSLTDLEKECYWESEQKGYTSNKAIQKSRAKKRIGGIYYCKKCDTRKQHKVKYIDHTYDDTNINIEFNCECKKCKTKTTQIETKNLFPCIYGPKC